MSTSLDTLFFMLAACGGTVFVTVLGPALVCLD